MKTVLYPIETNLFVAIQQYLTELVLDTNGESHGDKVLVGVISKIKSIPRRQLLVEWEIHMGNAFTLTVAQSRRDQLKIREFFSLLIQAVDVNWHADDLVPDHSSDKFPLYVCIRHQRWKGTHPSAPAKQPGFAVSAFFSMDSTTMEIKGDSIEVSRDEIYDDLDVLTLRYDTLP